MSKSLAFIAVFVIGALVMFLFDHWYTLLAGFAIQMTAVVLGAFEIASPDFLERDADESSGD